MNDELREIEDQLEKFSPAAMPDDMLARMEQAMERWQESVPVEEKIVAFEPVRKEKGRLRFFNAWASAAAVALIGAVSYTVFNGVSTTESTFADNANSVADRVPQVAAKQNIQNVVPASNSQFGTQVKGASKDVITYDSQGRPLRLMQVEFEDKVTIRGRDGKVYKVKQPRIEYYAVPVEIH
ncbi:MAG: hypothetical protein ABGY95_07425 [Rubritalea sp.]|uniref:hypothetical protein n=1 Tax=Rubritalea sp. TaxID=2109375 RepID=UPI003242CE92